MSEPSLFDRTLETSRLSLIRLTRAEFRLYLVDRSRFAKETGLSETPSKPTLEIQAALEWLYRSFANSDDEASVWSAPIAAVLRSERIFVGATCFKGVPREREAELAYFVEAPYRNKGYMTETLEAIVAWARSRDDVDSLVAETLVDNGASRRVLKKAGFRRVRDAPFPLVDSFCWRVAVK